MNGGSTTGTFLNAGPNFDVERVEVLPGPQGTLFGRSTTGGLINVVAVDPAGNV